jgi:YihY family inner membrane protein
MLAARQHHHDILRHPLAFVRQVLRGFVANQGLVLAGAVAYYALLSLIPLLILLLVALSHVVDESQVQAILGTYLNRLVPGESKLVLDQVSQFLEHRHALGWMMTGALLFFSSLAFGVLESAMGVIFSHRGAVHRRHALISFLLPYLYVLVLGMGLLATTLLNGALQSLTVGEIHLFRWHWSLDQLTAALLYSIGLLSEIGLLTLIYMLTPIGHLPWRHALIGGVAAALLWEGVRYGLIWYFANLSLVNVVYGSLGATIIALLTLEAGSIILLLGAQVIAEYERVTQETG